MHGGGSLTIAHSDKDIEKIIGAAKDVGKEMTDSVRSSSACR
jgi:hypothetical protein